MKNRFPLLRLLLVSLTLTGPARSEETEEFTPLFNGRDLSGWVPCNVAADTFSAKDGLIVTTGIPTGFMRTARMYENFVIELDWRHLKEAGNSGLFIWGEGLPAPGVPYARGIEVQILDLGYAKNQGNNVWFTTHGDIFPIWGATMTPLGRTPPQGGSRAFPAEDRTLPSPQWNHYRVECRDGEIRLSVNGKEVTHGKNCIPRKGYICLESEGSECHFKNIRIRELPSSHPTAEETARAYEGFVPLFNGKDIGGWRQAPEGKAWTSDGVAFLGATGEKFRGEVLRTEKEFGDYTLCVDWRLTDKPEKKPKTPDGSPASEEALSAGTAGIFLRGSSDAASRIQLGSPEILASVPLRQPADAPLGQWNRAFITVRNKKVTIELNEKVILDGAELPALPARGPIGLQSLGSGVEFCNLFIREE